MSGRSYNWDDNKSKTSESITGTMSGYDFTVGTSDYDAEGNVTLDPRIRLNGSFGVSSGAGLG